MTHPEQPGNWSDPSWSAQQPTGFPDPTHPMAAQPVTGQPVPGQPLSGQPVAQPGFAQPVGGQPGYGQPVGGQPVSGQPVSGQPGYGQPFPADGYAPPAPGYAPYGYPVMAAPPTNGLSIASLVVSIIGIVGLCGYGLGGYLGIVGAILGHISRRQIRDRERLGQAEAGDGMALAGVIMGWIATAIAVLATALIVFGIVWAVNHEPSTYDGN